MKSRKSKPRFYSTYKLTGVEAEKIATIIAWLHSIGSRPIAITRPDRDAVHLWEVLASSPGALVRYKVEVIYRVEVISEDRKSFDDERSQS